MKSKEEAKRALNKINVKVQLAPHQITAWDIIRLNTEYPFNEIKKYAQNIKEKIPRQILTSPQMVKEIAYFLSSPDVNIRALAKKILKEIDSEDTKKFLSPKSLNLRWIASQDLDPYLLAEAARYLGDIGEPEGVEPLIKALAHHHKLVRGSAALALGKIGDKKAIPHLIKALKDDELFVRERAATAMLNFPYKEAIVPLTCAYKDNFAGIEVAQLRLRRHCTQAILKIGLPCSAVLSEIMHMDEIPGVRVWAMTLLLIMGLLPIQEFIRVATEDDHDIHLDYINQVFRDLEVEISLYKDYFIPIVNGTKNLDFLKKVVYAKDQTLRKMALKRIYELDLDVFKDILGEVILCNWPKDKEIFLEYTDEIIPHIKQLLLNNGPHIKVNCLQLLGEMGNLKGIKIIEEHLFEKNNMIRIEALKVALRMNICTLLTIPENCYDELIDLIGTKWEEKALAEIKRINEPILEFIKDNLYCYNDNYLIKIILTLEAVGGNKSVLLLTKIWRKNKRKELGKFADEALNRLGRKSLLSRLLLPVKF